MQLTQSNLKIVIKMLLLMIFLTIVYLITALLFSARYWPDVYNYINANITIKRIPTISELNITIIEIVEEGYTTEMYPTTDNVDMSTVEEYEIDANDFTNLFDDKETVIRKKKYIEIEDVKDYSELPIRNIVIDYVFDNDDTVIKEDLTGRDNGLIALEETTKVIRDLIDESKLTKSDSKDVEMVTGVFSKLQEFYGLLEHSCHGNSSSSKISDVVFPWIVSIFIKNDTKDNQFEYYCDGALVSDRAVLTAARCVFTNTTLNPDNLLVILGKRSLHSMAESEKAHKINKIITHENFTIENGKTSNDLAILIMDEAVELSQSIQVACMNGEFGDNTKAATVAWDFTGDLEPVYFEKKKGESCDSENMNENTFCATYGDAVALCPNYGGVYVTKEVNNYWYLQGIRTGDPTVRGICFNKTVHYTSLMNYFEWITDTVDDIKSDDDYLFVLFNFLFGCRLFTSKMKKKKQTAIRTANRSDNSK